MDKNKHFKREINANKKKKSSYFILLCTFLEFLERYKGKERRRKYILGG